MSDRLSTTEFLRETSARVHDVAAVAHAVLAAAEGGTERKALGIAFDINQFTPEARALTRR